MANVNNKPISGTQDATSSAVALPSSGELIAGVWVHVASGGDDVEVIADGSTQGPRASDGTPMFFPAVKLEHVEIKRTGGSDQTIYYWAY